MPRLRLRVTAAIRPGKRLGRIDDISLEIGLASSSASEPPPKCAASARVMNDHVTASVMPRAASSRRARRDRFCFSVSTACATPLMRGSGVEGILSRPAMRTTSSTRSAEPWISGRHVGTVTLATPLAPSNLQPSASRMPLISASGSFTPDSSSTRVRSKAMTRFSTGSLPATFIFVGSPPQSFTIMSVARSSPPLT